MFCKLSYEHRRRRLVVSHCTIIIYSDAHGLTPFLYACRATKVDVMEYLFKCGANIHHTSASTERGYLGMSVTHSPQLSRASLSLYDGTQLVT
jgi:ankyrin repeat protein